MELKHHLVGKKHPLPKLHFGVPDVDFPGCIHSDHRLFVAKLFKK